MARRAAVSVKTVSRVINDSEQVSDYTREKVVRAMKDLDYRPNAFARGLVTKTSNMIGVTIPDICNPYFAELVRGIEDTASEYGYSVFICNTDEDQEKETKYIGALQEKQVDALILCSSRVDEEAIGRLSAARRSFVLVNRDFRVSAVNRISVDDLSVGLRSVEHFVRDGRRRIGYIGGPSDSLNTRTKLAGYRQGLGNAGIDLDPKWYISGHPSIRGGYEATRRLFENAGPPGSQPVVDALFVYNDLMAVGAITFLREIGCAVPEQVAVIGCDDIPMVSHLSPSLTTFRVPTYEIGEAAMTTLLEELSSGGSNGSTRNVFIPEFVERESSG